jgi:protein-tyrosine kinase
MSIIEKAVRGVTQSERPVGTLKRRKKSPERLTNRPPRTEPRSPARIAFREPLQSHGMLVNRQEDALAYDQVRRIKRPILQRAFGAHAQPAANVIAVTSATLGAGKSFVSVNLAAALSIEKDYRVVLIDADNTKASVTKALGLDDQPGLFDVLADESLRLSDVAHECTDADLTVVPTGGQATDSVELLTSLRTKDVLAEWAPQASHTLVVVDSPPLLGSPDTLAIVTLAGQILVVAAVGMTGYDALNRALGLLDEEKPTGLILNKMPSTILLSEEEDSYTYGHSPDD